MIELGIERVERVKERITGKRIGLVTNQTGCDAQLTPTQAILERYGPVTALFSPEHGFAGSVQAGGAVADRKKDRTPLYSLYGKHRRPTKGMLENVEILCFDIQDVGARFYTYLSTLREVMVAASIHGLPVIVFDRPNPVGGRISEGRLIKEGFTSFVGCARIVERYGLTIGEFAAMIHEQERMDCPLTVVPMAGWKRKMDFVDTGLPWILPSPNIPTADSCFTYLSTCLFEGTNVSEGRGTTKPFSFIGAPWIDPVILLGELKQHDLPGVLFRVATFVPTFSKYRDTLCHGLELIVRNRSIFRPVRTGYTLLDAIRRTHSDFSFRKPSDSEHPYMIDLLTGDGFIRDEAFDLNEAIRRIETDSRIHQAIKERYHLYED
ncbi:MAG: exo-beta-N-acetylmuramidase NamZ domain-containing protein [Acholeplasmataceae bacterium]